MIPLFFSLHLSVGRVWRSYDQQPLTSLTDDAPRAEHVYDHSYLPEENSTNGEAENSVDFDKRDHSCVKRKFVQTCGGSPYTVVECLSSSLTSCYSSINEYGTRKCEVKKYVIIPQCGSKRFATECGCAS